MGQDRYSPVTVAFARSPRAPHRFGVIIIIGLMIFACYGAVRVRNGILDCTVLDQWLKLTPCRAVLASDEGAFRNDVAFSPDSRTLAVAAQTVTLWDVATGAYLQTVPLPGDGQPIKVRFSPDGASIAVVGSWGIQVLDVTTMRVRYTLPALGVKGVAFSPDGRWLAQSELVQSGQASFGQVRIFDANDGRFVRTMPGKYTLGYYDLYFTPDSHHLLVWIEIPRPSNTRIARWIWNITNDQITEEIGYGDVSADARLLRLSDGTGTVMALNDSNDQYVVQYTPPHGCPGGWDAAFLSDPDRLISVSNTYDEISFALWPSESYTRVCRLTDGQILWESQAQGYCVEVAPNNRVVAVCEFARVQLWDVPATWNQ